MICATDPVATCDTFNEHAVDHLMEILVVGEALVNDAAAIVLYKTFKEWVLYEDGQNSVTAVKAVVDFSKFVAVSIFIGMCVAIICALVFKHFSFDGNPGLEITVFLLMAYSTFLIAEFYHVSGILSSLMGGVIMAYYAQRSLSDYSQLPGQETAVRGMLQMLSALSNMVIFLMVGMALVVCGDSFSLLFTLLVLVFTLCGRAIAIFPLTWVVNRFRSEKIPYNFAVMMWWSGLRGAVALALAVDMPSRHRFMMVSTTCVLVTFTVLVYGGSTLRMLRALKIRTGVHEDDDNHGDSSQSARMQAWHVWNNRVLVPLLCTKPPPLLDGDAKAELANDELSLTKKALAAKTKELSDYARTKDRQIEKIMKQAEDKQGRPGCVARIVTFFFNARCFLIIFNALLVALAVAAIVGGNIVLNSEFGIGDMEKSMQYFIAASSFVLLASLIGFFGACTRARCWLCPYITLLLVTMALQTAGLALAFEVTGALEFAEKVNFDVAQYRAKEADAMEHLRRVANSTFALNRCETTHKGTAMAFSCDSAWLARFSNERCVKRSDEAGFSRCAEELESELHDTTEIFCACRAAVVALVDKHSTTMAGIVISVTVLELLLLIFSCKLICAPSRANDIQNDAYLDAVFEDKDVIKCTKALSDAKEAASKKLKGKHEREQAKIAKQMAKLDTKKAKSESAEKKEKKAAKEKKANEVVGASAMKKATRTVV